MRSIRLRLGNRSNLQRIIDYVRGVVVLHNFLMAEPIDAKWIENQETEDDDLESERGHTRETTADHTRMNELFYYLSELRDTPIN